jgi:predicted ATPase
MITKWKVENFKSISSLTELTFRPLTLFAGANSAGKSTWIQSILLIAQTLASKVSSRSVVLNGHLARLGQFDDLKSYGAKTNAITIGWECQPRVRGAGLEVTDPNLIPEGFYITSEFDDLVGIACEIQFDVDATSSLRDLMQLQPRLKSCRVSSKEEDSIDNASGETVPFTREAEIIVEREPDDPDAIFKKLSKLQLPDLQAGEYLKSTLQFRVQMDESSEALIKEDIRSAEPVGCSFRHFLPSYVTVRFDEAEEEARAIVELVLGSRLRHKHRRYLQGRELLIPDNIRELMVSRIREGIKSLFEPFARQLIGDETKPLTVNEWVERVKRMPNSAQTNLRTVMAPIADDLLKAFRADIVARFSLAQAPPGNLADACNYVDRVFSQSVKYLGPLRDEPKPLYPLALTADPSDVGLRGEFTAAVFDLHKRRAIRYLPSARLAETPIQPQLEFSYLESAAHDWLSYLGVAERVETTDKGKLGHELKVITSTTQRAQDLTHVGVGVSQVLPILVMCLLADADTTLIIEQPELHLHPRVQTRLADFFLAMAMQGKQCIIETHSEYLISRLRHRIATSPGDSMTSMMKLYFVESGAQGSKVRDIVVNQYGAISEWPEGFFDEGQRESEAILRAAVAKRKKQRNAQ